MHITPGAPIPGARTPPRTFEVPPGTLQGRQTRAIAQTETPTRGVALSLELEGLATRRGGRREACTRGCTQGAVGVQTPCPHGLGDRRTLAALGMSCLVRAPCSRPGTSGQCVLTCGPGLPICPGPLRGWTEQGRPVTGAACQQADPGDPARPPLCRFDLHLSPHTLGRPLQGRESSQQTTGPNEGVGGAGRGRDLRGEGRGPRSHLCDLTCANVRNQPLWASGHRNQFPRQPGPLQGDLSEDTTPVFLQTHSAALSSTLTPRACLVLTLSRASAPPARRPVCWAGSCLERSVHGPRRPGACVPPSSVGTRLRGPRSVSSRLSAGTGRVTPRHAPARSSSLRPPAPPRRGLPAGQSCWPDAALRCRLLAGRGRAGLPPLPAVPSPQASVCALRVDARPRRGASPGVERSLTRRLQV